MDSTLFWSIVSAAITVVALAFGGAWLQAKGKVTQLKELGKAVVDAIESLDVALADNTLTVEEVAAVKLNLLAVKTAFNILIGKV